MGVCVRGVGMGGRMFERGVVCFVESVLLLLYVRLGIREFCVRNTGLHLE